MLECCHKLNKFMVASNNYIISARSCHQREALSMLKCMKCPYKLGLIKCPVNPCPQCISSKSKKPPFPETEIKSNKSIIKKG